MKFPMIFVSDLHGVTERFRKTFEVAIEEKAKAILIGGDVASGSPASQKEFFEREIRGLYNQYKDHLPPIYAIPGNDDWKTAEEGLRKFDKIMVPMGKSYPLVDRYSIIGYPYVPITPFHFKDFEKWDLNPENQHLETGKRLRNLNGYRSEGESLKPFKFKEEDRTDTIENDLEKIAGLSKPQKTLYLFHCPPDRVHDQTISIVDGEERHIGSFALRKFIEEKQPIITFHGHRHEQDGNASPIAYLGKTPCIACGTSDKASGLRYIKIDLFNMSDCKVGEI